MVYNKDTFPIFQLWYVRFLRKIAETVTVQMPIKNEFSYPVRHLFVLKAFQHITFSAKRARV